ncbi:hypothetical protein M4I21_05210 [Cellulophaga sp. 20_2_10]|uniref:hypothetical protein n=1 Tax=Cellulophaga sp. 20_2_10 TaxID=2942476 RepID=UPI00201A7662|nr:hypothetical protein [Cellulophaga sp. 20_2_10]MCL5245197.1 hypothetical protein [Cellulophaga sp. 20_2_10]
MKKCILLVFVLVFCLSNNSIPKENRYESEFTFIIGPDANNQQIKKRLEFYSSYSRIITHVHISEDRLIIKFENFVSPKKVNFLLETAGLAQIRAANSSPIPIKESCNIRVTGNVYVDVNSLAYSDRSKLTMFFKDPQVLEDFSALNIGENLALAIGDVEISKAKIREPIKQGSLSYSFIQEKDFNACIIGAIINSPYTTKPSMELVEHKLNFNNESISKELIQKYNKIKGNEELIKHIEFLVKKSASTRPDLSSKNVAEYFPDIEALSDIRSLFRIIYTNDIGYFLTKSKCTTYSDFEALIDKISLEIKTYGNFYDKGADLRKKRFIANVYKISKEYFKE